MVGNRLPFLDIADPDIELRLSNFTLEIMSMLTCLKKEGAQIGHEEEYTVQEQSFIADLVALYELLRRNAENYGASGSSSTGASLGVFLKKAKAGSAEVEYDKLDAATISATAGSTNDLYNRLRNSAINKGAILGCLIDFTEESGLIFIDCTVPAPPFRVAGSVSDWSDQT